MVVQCWEREGGAGNSSRRAAQDQMSGEWWDKRWFRFLYEGCDLTSRLFFVVVNLHSLPLKLVQLNGQVCDFNEIPEVLVRTVIKTKPGCPHQMYSRTLQYIAWCCLPAGPWHRTRGIPFRAAHANPPSQGMHLYWLLKQRRLYFTECSSHLE